MVYGGLPDASLEEAEKLLRQALTVRQRPIHHYNLARVLEETDRRKEAISELEKAVMLDPTYPHEQVEIDAAKKMLMELTD
jgi:tetratricopeptide (TPR) repeat protein